MNPIIYAAALVSITVGAVLFGSLVALSGKRNGICSLCGRTNSAGRVCRCRISAE